MEFIHRHISDDVQEALEDRPVVLITGARQTGKSTLVQQLCQKRNMTYLTLDDLTLLAAVQNDPAGFVSGLKGQTAIDEVQRVPDLLLAIKASVDQDRTPGRFILTGSANVMVVPKISESLAGRKEVLTLFPFSKSELLNVRYNFLDRLFSDGLSEQESVETNDNALFEAILKGGYPEVQRINSERRRTAWFKSYIATLLQRDIRDLSQIEGLAEMPRLLSFLAAQSCGLLNLSELSRHLSLSAMSMKRYVALLQAVYIVRLLPAWSGNIGKRLIKSPKIFLNDTGLLAYLTGMTESYLKMYPEKKGILFENFVMQELEKLISWSDLNLNLYYYRTASGREVDFVLETSDGRIAGIEVKCSSTLHLTDFKGIYDFSDSVKGNFHIGIVLYTGSRVIPFGEKLFAVPVSLLWRDAS